VYVCVGGRCLSGGSLGLQTQRLVREYDLARQTHTRTLRPNVRWISSAAVHPSGLALVVGSYDRRVAWLDPALAGDGGGVGTGGPTQTLRFHREAVRAVAFHARAPLFATAADDGTVHVFHGKVTDAEALEGPSIVPLKVLRGHAITDGLGTQSHAEEHASLRARWAAYVGRGLRRRAGVLDCVFHPTQPWLVSAGADGTARLYT
jgi:ribosome biogenesis protein ERB1